MVYGLINTDLLVTFLQTGKGSDHLVPLSTRNTQCFGISYKFRSKRLFQGLINSFLQVPIKAISLLSGWHCVNEILV